MKGMYYPEGMMSRGGRCGDWFANPERLSSAMAEGRILEGTAQKCTDALELYLDTGDGSAAEGVIPREEALRTPEGERFKDVAVLSRVGQPVAFRIIGIEHGSGGRIRAVCSRRAAQEEAYENYVSKLLPGDIIDAKVTHLEQFGAFCDIGCVLTALMPVDAISVSRIRHPSDRFECGEFIKAVVRSNDRESGRITLSQRELLGTWEENAALFTPGQTVAGIVRSIESYGVFVELAPNLAGLCELKEGISVGQTAAVYIKSIIPEKMKIKLVMINAQKEVPGRARTGRQRLFLDTEKVRHLDYWRYSPPCCQKTVETHFYDEFE